MEEQKDLGSYSEDDPANAAQVPCAVGYTPGEWSSLPIHPHQITDGVLVVDYDAPLERYAVKATYVLDGRRYTSFPGEFPVTAGRVDEAKANARLFLAAPDLLAACREAKQLLINDLDEPGRTVFWKLVNAIGKAVDQ